jgi:hypothetical protein
MFIQLKRESLMQFKTALNISLLASILAAPTLAFATDSANQALNTAANDANTVQQKSQNAGTVINNHGSKRMKRDYQQGMGEVNKTKSDVDSLQSIAK